MTGPNQHNDRKQGRRSFVALSLAGLVAAMLGLSFAAVPLYRIFCQATGYNGTPQRADRGADHELDRTITIRFDSNVDKGLDWSFVPVQNRMDVKIGETALAFFKATNNSDRPITGSAIFNVSPEQAGPYFNKIECFCFTKQTLAPGASKEMPVTFFVDPKMVDDDSSKNLTEITLSYTFYRSDDQPGVAAVGQDQNSGS
ncbi:MAG: cytochrome c oxidase assembly protein [Hyphomicrobiales bacterium]|jgi:cytochrome c oxidase assembly protein subunit 11